MDLNPIKSFRAIDRSCGAVYHREFSSLEDIKDRWLTSYNFRWFFGEQQENLKVEVIVRYATPWKQVDVTWEN